MYAGPDPTQINLQYPPHTYELITCLVNGEQKRIIQDRYLKKFGSSKEEYIKSFPGAPLKSLAASDSYRSYALSDKGRKTRSRTITKLNLEDDNFQSRRKTSCKEFLESNRSVEYREKKSELAKEQHRNGQANYVRKYFEERYQGSDVQKEKSIRMSENNPGADPIIREKMVATYIKNREEGLHESRFKKKKYKDTLLIYQSSYEWHFLDHCDTHNILHRIKNAPILTDKAYPFNFYEPDYLLDDVYIIEIKSWWIEKLQEEKTPGLLGLKKSLVISKGYKFLYLRDKDYTDLLAVLS